MYNSIKLLTSLLFLLYPLLLIAEPIIIGPEDTSVNLGKKVLILNDRSGEFDFTRIIHEDTSELFHKSNSDIPNYGYTSSIFWVKISIESTAKQSREMYLEVGYPLLDLMEFYEIGENGAYHLRNAGDHFPFYDREVRYRNPIFKLNLKPGENTCYLKIKSSSSMSFPLTLQTPDAFSGYVINEYIALGLYYGILLVMVGLTP